MEDKKVAQRKERIKKYISKWWEDNHNKIFVLILIFAFAIRLYFFIHTINQPMWWDEADYVFHSKVALGIQKDFTDYKWMIERPSLIYIIFGTLFKFGFSNAGVRFIEIIFSLISITAVYLLGSTIFNKKIGLFAALLQSVFWQDLFFAQRFMLGIPSMAFGLLGVYFFWKGYVKKEIKNYWIYLGLFLGLSAIIRHTGLIFLIFIIVYGLVIERFNFLKQKDLWKSLAIIVLLEIFSILSILYFSQGNWYSQYLFTGGSGLGGSLSNSMGFSGMYNYLQMMVTTYFGGIIGWVFLISFIYAIIKIILIADLLFKSKEHKNSKELFLVIWILAVLIFFGYFVNHIEPRYLMSLFPAAFILLGSQISELIKNKKLVILVLIIIALIAVFTQIPLANQSISNKATSYLQVKQSGEWIKQNSQQNDIILSKSVPQLKVYASREVVWPDNDTPEGMIDFIKKQKPKYYMVSVFEPLPQWAYQLPGQYPEIFIPVKAYSLPENPKQPALVVYAVNNQNLSYFDKPFEKMSILNQNSTT